MLSSRINWEIALLKRDPFSVMPPRNPKDAVWAGFKDLKNQFRDLFIESFTNENTQVVLNWGRYGSGKTHSAVYFRDEEHFTFLDKRQIKKPFVFYIQTPKEPSESDLILYRDFIEAIKFKTFRKIVRDLIQEYGEQETKEKLQELAESEALGKALWLLGMENNPFSTQVQLNLFDESKSSDEWNRLLESYFVSSTKPTKSELKELGLSRGIETIQDRFKILGALLQCLIGLDPVDNIDRHNRVIFWIDELETLVYYPSKRYYSFTQGLRELIDRLPHYFTLMLNITLASPEAFEDAEVAMGQALLDRVTHKLYLREPTPDEAFEYISELLRLYRTEDPTQYNLPNTYPFDEESLRILIATLPILTPRKLNQQCAEVIKKAIARGLISESKENLIDKQFIAEIEEELIEHEIN